MEFFQIGQRLGGDAADVFFAIYLMHAFFELIWENAFQYVLVLRHSQWCIQ